MSVFIIVSIYLGLSWAVADQSLIAKPRDLTSTPSEFGINFLRLGKQLESGFCITVEPGIYFIPELFAQWKKDKKLSHLINYNKFETYMNFGGIRIEDNIWITKENSENLSDFIIKEIQDIENIKNE